MEKETTSELSEHPQDMTEQIIDQIEEQETRLRNRNSGDLKYELLNNIYPLLKSMCLVNTQIIDDLYEDDDGDDSESEVTDEATIAAVENTSNACKAIIRIRDIIASCSDKSLKEQTSTDLKFLGDFAEATLLSLNSNDNGEEIIGEGNENNSEESDSEESKIEESKPDETRNNEIQDR